MDRSTPFVRKVQPFEYTVRHLSYKMYGGLEGLSKQTHIPMTTLKRLLKEPEEIRQWQFRVIAGALKLTKEQKEDFWEGWST